MGRRRRRSVRHHGAVAAIVARSPSDWASDLEHAGLRVGWRTGAGAGWGGGGALHCGGGAGAGLCWAAWADGGAVCCRPVWCCREPDVPHRGFGALACGWGSGLSRARRCAGEAARLPHRAWRDRGGADAASCGGAGGGDCARGCSAATGGWWPMWWRRPAKLSMRRRCGRMLGAAFPTTWCRRHLWFWIGCR